ncbi:hypothetical protein [Antarcticimicrobium sediminis]|uniref:Uncharacterized protein n=1 Tax=Antarcticimicrobium sediminis TaxID=2546227 RepID=A0A4V2Z6V4_9RHOB|nr:hypothetical protein [Antarcticimicrobium sediminis]TDE34146.1 hypothetical protein E1B25_20365 [Antarcticimicrobium sediminis]
MMAPIIKNNVEFRDLWANAPTIAAIAAHYGVAHVSTVSKAARRFGLPRRDPGKYDRSRCKSGLKGAPKRGADAARAARAAEVDAKRAMGLVERLIARGIASDAASGLALGLVKARRYIDLEDLGERYSVPLARLLPIWHEVRV